MFDFDSDFFYSGFESSLITVGILLYFEFEYLLCLVYGGCLLRTFWMLTLVESCLVCVLFLSFGLSLVDVVLKG